MDRTDCLLLTLLQEGLPLCSRPYQALAQQLVLSERDVISRLRLLTETGIIKRLGTVVNHRRLGYRANAMVVFNVPDRLVDQVGERLSRLAYINLCYQRPRGEKDWPYNLYCMIHGKSRDRVHAQLEEAVIACGLENFPREILFSTRCYKQRGAVYGQSAIKQAVVNG